MGTKIISPYIIGLLSDKSENPMRIIHWTNFLALSGFALLFLIPEVRHQSGINDVGLGDQRSFIFLCFIVFFFSFFWNGVIAQYEAVTLLNLGQDYHRYGSIRVWGSAGFIVAVIVLGELFEALSINLIPLVMLSMFAAIWISSLMLQSLCPTRRVDSSPERGSFSSIIRSSHVLAILVVCFLMKFSYGTYYTFYTIYLIDYGYSESMIGVLWGVSVMAELILFYYAGRFIQRFAISHIFMVCILVAGLRWLMIGTNPSSLTILFIAQCTHAITFAIYHAAAIEWVRRAFGVRFMGQGQALYSAVSFGLGGALGALLCGFLWTNQRSIWWEINWYISAGAMVIAALVMFFAKLPKAIERGG